MCVGMCCVLAFVSSLDSSTFLVVSVSGAGRDSVPSVHVHPKGLRL